MTEEQDNDLSLPLGKYGEYALPCVATAMRLIVFDICKYGL